MRLPEKIIHWPDNIHRYRDKFWILDREGLFHVEDITLKGNKVILELVRYGHTPDDNQPVTIEANRDAFPDELFIAQYHALI